MKLKVAVIGVGYWGPNFVRNFIRNKLTEVVWVCDLSQKALDEIKQYYPQLKLTRDYQEILNDDSVDLVMVTTPPESHYKITKDALNHKKHVIVAKPLTTNSKKALELYQIAKKKGLLLYGDLTYLYTGAVKYIKKFIEKGSIGSPLYYDSIRANLGLIQKDVSVVWDLAPHDFAIIDDWFGLEPEQVFATASRHFGRANNYEMAHITVNYSKSFIAHIHVSWLSPVKLRTVLVGGTKRMISFDDIAPDEKVKIYDKGVDIASEDITYMKPVYRSGDILVPKLKVEEAIYQEIEDVVTQIVKGKIDYANAKLNIRIIEILEACDKSLKNGRIVKINSVLKQAE